MPKSRSAGGSAEMSRSDLKDATARLDVEAGDRAEQRRLAAARRAEEADELALAHLERDVLQRREAAEVLGEVLDAQIGPRSRLVGAVIASPPVSQTRTRASGRRRRARMRCGVDRCRTAGSRLSSAPTCRRSASTTPPGSLAVLGGPCEVVLDHRRVDGRPGSCCERLATPGWRPPRSPCRTSRWPSCVTDQSTSFLRRVELLRALDDRGGLHVPADALPSGR